MSNILFKHLPWVAPTAAILAVGSGFMDRVAMPFGLGAGEPEVAQPIAEDTTQAIAALAAVTAATTPDPVVAQEPVNASDQLVALLSDPGLTADPQEDVVSRAQGFAITTEAPIEEVVAAVPEAPQAATDPVGTDFFAAAQAELDRAGSCVNDLRSLAQQAKIYFPSGALNGEETGIAQARLIGTIAAQCPGVSIQVEGHSDPSGDPVLNLRLSQERAEAVISRISAAGIDTSNMVAVGLGSARPSNVVGPQPDDYYDRRVEFSIVEVAQTASFAAPPTGAESNWQQATCVTRLQDATDAITITYSPGSVLMTTEDLDAALELAELATACPDARLRLIGQHADNLGTVEDAGTARLRAVALMTRLVAAGYPSEQIIIAAPSESQPIQGFSDSRVDFDVILEDL